MLAAVIFFVLCFLLPLYSSFFFFLLSRLISETEPRPNEGSIRRKIIASGGRHRLSWEQSFWRR